MGQQPALPLPGRVDTLDTLDTPSVVTPCSTAPLLPCPAAPLPRRLSPRCPQRRWPRPAPPPPPRPLPPLPPPLRWPRPLAPPPPRTSCSYWNDPCGPSSAMGQHDEVVSDDRTNSDDAVVAAACHLAPRSPQCLTHPMQAHAPAMPCLSHPMQAVSLPTPPLALSLSLSFPFSFLGVVASNRSPTLLSMSSLTFFSLLEIFSCEHHTIPSHASVLVTPHAW